MAIRERDDRGEADYERRAEVMPAEQAAALAVEIISPLTAYQRQYAGDGYPRLEQQKMLRQQYRYQPRDKVVRQHMKQMEQKAPAGQQDRGDWRQTSHPQERQHQATPQQGVATGHEQQGHEQQGHEQQGHEQQGHEQRGHEQQGRGQRGR